MGDPVGSRGFADQPGLGRSDSRSSTEAIRSMGIGKMIVEVFSPAIAVSVCR